MLSAEMCGAVDEGRAAERLKESGDEDPRLVNMNKMLCLAVAYSATVGGTATLTGTPPNLVFAKLLNRFLLLVY